MITYLPLNYDTPVFPAYLLFNAYLNVLCDVEGNHKIIPLDVMDVYRPIIVLGHLQKN